MSDLKPRLADLLEKGFEVKDLEDGTAVLTRAQRSLLVPIRTAYHQFLQHHRKQLCFLDTMTLLKIDERITKGEIALSFEKMGLKVRTLILLDLLTLGVHMHAPGLILIILCRLNECSVCTGGLSQNWGGVTCSSRTMITLRRRSRRT